MEKKYPRKIFDRNGNPQYWQVAGKKIPLIYLITPEEFHTLKKGTRLRTISNKSLIVGQHDFSSLLTDLRGGFLSFGFEEQI